MKRAKTIMKRLREDTEYQKFFQAAMDKFKINTPADLKDPAKKKEFFDYVDNNYKAKSEITETNKNMKATEFRKLIREEVRKVVKEQDDDYGVSFAYMKPYIKDISRVIKTLQILNDRIETDGPLSEDIVDALELLEALYKKIDKAK